MKKQLSTSKKGFTIIEVVLVLAIAGLIFLMVFVALPALQRSQRDTQRRDDMARVASALTNWQTNNNNNLPSDATGATKLISDYLGGTSEFKDPDGTSYTITIGSGALANASNYGSHTINVQTNAKCSGEAAVAGSGNSNFAVLYKLEGAGTVCVDNQ